MKNRTLLWEEDGTSRAFERTTIRELGHAENFLEDRIAEHPEILGLDSLGSGITGPYQVFKQSALSAPTGRTVWPDIVLVSRSAHLIAVEVKLEDNPELRNRAVVAQVVEYASSLSALDAGDLTELLGRGSADPLPSLIAGWFPDCDDPHEFADVLLGRCARGEIDLVIACDRCPPGLTDLGAALDRQKALAFRLQVAEVAPWVVHDQPGRILFQNRVPIRTEIVARTQISVSWEQGDTEPSVTVNTTSLEEVEDALNAARAGSSPKRMWSAEEIRREIEADDKFAEDDRATLLRLLDIAIKNSHGGQITNQKTVHPTFCFRVATPGEKRSARPIWTAGPRDACLWIMRRNLRSVLGEERASEAEDRLASWTRQPRHLGPEYISFPIADLVPHLRELEELTLWIKQQASD